ncbi:MAG: hypothetical protein JAY61_03520, partial [Candidatus Thiodiazotropha taylori]|nr:hypothetical protein [Candidatus Thiodiazotropha taylori]
PIIEKAADVSICGLIKKSCDLNCRLTGSSDHRRITHCPEEQSALNHHLVGRFDLIHALSIAWIQA